MKKFLCAVMAASICASQVFAADYDFIDAGDTFYINDFGSENRHVEVVRKLGGASVKVRNLATGEAFSIQASRLLTSAELRREETTNKVGTTAVIAVGVLCLLSPDTCKNDE